MSSACSLACARSAGSATPPGTAWAVQWPARSGAPVRPAPSRPRRPCAALPSAEACPSWSDRRGPRCARLTGRPLNLAQPVRASAPRAARGSGAALARAARQRLGSFVASEGPHGPPLCETVGSPWTKPGRFECPRFATGRNARPGSGGLPARTPPGCTPLLRLRSAVRRPLRQRALRCPRPG
jgi:hypothetical protein